MIGGVTHTMLPHLSGVPHLHVNRLLDKRSPGLNFRHVVEGMPEIQAKRFPLLDFHRFSLSIAKKSLDR